MTTLPSPLLRLKELLAKQDSGAITESEIRQFQELVWREMRPLLAAAEKSERYRRALDRIANARPEEADEYFDKSRLFKCMEVAQDALRDEGEGR